MQLAAILDYLFPKTCEHFRLMGCRRLAPQIEGMAKDLRDARAELERQVAQNNRLAERIVQQREQCAKEGYERGFRAGSDHRKSIITIEDEREVGFAFDEYASEEERELVAQIVESPQYKEGLRPNLLRQAIFKRHQAGLNQKDPQAMRFLHAASTLIVDLIAFYDHAPDYRYEASKQEDDGGFDTILP